MALELWRPRMLRPFRDLAKMEREMEDLFGRFEWPWRAGVDADKVKTTFKKGVLEVHLPKSREAKGRKIDVKAE